LEKNGVRGLEFEKSFGNNKTLKMDLRDLFLGVEEGQNGKITLERERD
jgi:hypothetical protein